METKNLLRIKLLHSLRFQLVAGAVALLGLTIGAISYLLMQQQIQSIKNDLRETIVLQGRNIALSSAKGLLRSDPEFELIPIVTRISENAEQIESIVITGHDDVILADLELQNIATQFALNVDGYENVASPLLAVGEKLYEDRASFKFKSPIKGREKTIGFVYLGYSKQGLRDAIRQAIAITVVGGGLAFALGILLALWLFRRISQPMTAMIKGVKALGLGDLDTRIELPMRNEFGMLADSFNEMASQLSMAQQELVDKHVMDHELTIAHDIQSTLIPKSVHQPKGFEIGLHYKSATQVGGDYVDVIQIDKRHIALVIADVSGKGIPGLVVMAMLKVFVHDLVKKRVRPSEVVRRLNQPLMANIKKNMFVTMSLGVFDTETGTLRYSNAGHSPLLIYRGDKKKCSLYSVGGRPLGLFSDQEFEPYVHEVELTLGRGDLFMMHTDGLTESMNQEHNQFGYERMMEVCSRRASQGAEHLIGHLVKAEGDFRQDAPQSDDLTLLAIAATTSNEAIPEPVGST